MSLNGWEKAVNHVRKVADNQWRYDALIQEEIQKPPVGVDSSDYRWEKSVPLCGSEMGTPT
jgi:hypothetical protein